MSEDVANVSDRSSDKPRAAITGLEAFVEDQDTEWTSDFDFDISAAGTDEAAPANISGCVHSMDAGFIRGHETSFGSSSSEEEDDWDKLLQDDTNDSGSDGGHRNSSHSVDQGILRVREMLISGSMADSDGEGIDRYSKEHFEHLNSLLKYVERAVKEGSVSPIASNCSVHNNAANIRLDDMENDLLKKTEVLKRKSFQQRKRQRKEKSRQDRKRKYPLDMLRDVDTESSSDSEDDIYGSVDRENFDPNIAFKSAKQLRKIHEDKNINDHEQSLDKLKVNVQQLERELATLSLEVNDKPRSIKYHQKLIDRLCRADSETVSNGKLTELVYVIEVLASLRVELGDFDDAEACLRRVITVMKKWIRDPLQADSWSSLAVVEHLQVLRLRLVRLYISSARVGKAARECQSLIDFVKKTELNPHKKQLKCTALRLWLVETLMCPATLHLAGENLEILRHHYCVRKKTTKYGRSHARSICVSPAMTLKSMYKPEDPPSFGMLVVRFDVAKGNLEDALNGSCAMVRVLESLLNVTNQMETFSSWSSRNPLAILGDALALRASILAKIAQPSTALHYPVNEKMAWKHIGIAYDDLEDLGLKETHENNFHVYSSTYDVVTEAARMFHEAASVYSDVGDLYNAEEAKIRFIEVYVDTLFTPIVLHRGSWPTDFKPEFLDSRLRASLATSNVNCIPLHLIRCQISAAELALMRDDTGGNEEAMINWEAARDLFLHLFVDGDTLPAIQATPLPVALEIERVVSRMVRFLLCSQTRDVINNNLLLLDVLLLAQIEVARRATKPLSAESFRSLFSFHQMSNLDQQLDQDPKPKARSSWSYLFQLRHASKIQRRRTGAVLTDRTIMEENQRIIGQMAIFMSSLRRSNNRPGCSEITFQSVVETERSHANLSSEKGGGSKTSDSYVGSSATRRRPPPVMLERVYRCCYAIDLGYSLVAVYAPLTGAKHIFFCGVRSYFEENVSPGAQVDQVDSIKATEPNCASINDGSRQYLSHLLLSTSPPSTLERKSWDGFMADVGDKSLSRLASDLCNAAAEAEVEDGFVPRGVGHDTENVKFAHIRCNIKCLQWKRSDLSDIRSPVPPGAPIVILQSRSLVILPFEEMVSSQDHHHVTRSISLLSLLSVRYRFHNRREKSCLGSKAGPAIATSASMAAMHARVPYYISFFYSESNPRELRLQEQSRIKSSFQRALAQLNCHVVATNQVEKVCQRQLKSDSEYKLSLQYRMRHVGTHTMHCPFQCPLSLSDDCRSLKILRMGPDHANCEAIVSRVDGQIASSRENIFPVIFATMADLFELSESLLLLMAWVHDCSFVFVPASVFAKAVEIFSKVDAVRVRCLAKDASTKKHLRKKIAKYEALSKSAISVRKREKYEKLLSRRHLPYEWETPGSTLEAAAALVRHKTQLPCIVLNSPTAEI